MFKHFRHRLDRHVGCVRPTWLVVTRAASLLGCLLGLHPSNWAHAQATFTPLGTLVGTGSRAYDVSADGSVVVGTFFDEAVEMVLLFHWTAQSTTRGPRIGVLPQAVAVSADGNVVVSAMATGPFPVNLTVPIRWTVDTDRQSLGHLPGNDNSAALDVSGDGAVVVGRSGAILSNPEVNPDAFRWTESSGVVALQGLPADRIASVANGVSPDGSVVVGRVSLPAARAFRWTADAGMVELPLPATSATRISADESTIVGQMGSVTFRWTESTGVVGLGDLPGGDVRSTAHDVSADGSVVVGSSETFSDPGPGLNIDEAFYWTAPTGMLNLRDALIANGATGLDGWTLTEARGVSYDGLTIVGTGVRNGVTEAWVATIPEPSTLILAALAAIALTAPCRRQWSAGAVSAGKTGR